MITPAGFARVVQRHLIDPLGDLGLTVVSRSGFSVRLEGDGVFVQVDYDSVRSHELELWVGQAELPEPPFSLGDLLRSTDCPRDQVAGVDLIQVSDEATLERQLARCAELLWVYGGPFLRGDVFALDLIERDVVPAEQAAAAKEGRAAVSVVQTGRASTPLGW